MSAEIVQRILWVLGGLLAAIFCVRVVRHVEPGKTEEVDYVRPTYPVL